MLFTDEVKDMQELVDKLSEFDQDFGKVKVAVVCFVFDKNNNVILNRRGPGARDEVGKLQAIGGSVNKTDGNFRDSVLRELREEAGTNLQVKVGRFLGAQLDGKIDNHTGEYVNWIILGYKGVILDGEVENMEPDRCIGFERGPLDSFKKDDLSLTAFNFIQRMMNNNTGSK